ncbi:TlpA disulfide reductase family protein [Saccharophagus degradans]|uniref:TlpA family protein disulfide reductase n=1 Tax=Saccharophagus degradans TaxID=86304 RepID=UPI002477D2A9|nr:TlpA disulfide reductase family protein [Saccharophagus degradans]WGO97363.1 TlpA disulfide reductase family protein [Saccharophagus degradans]
MKTFIKQCTLALSVGLSSALLSATAFSEGTMQGEAAPSIPGLEQYKGKPVLIDFWASWCEPCQESFPWMNEIKAQYPDLEIIAINLDEEKATAEAFLKNNTADFKVMFDPEGVLAEKYQVDGMPSSYLVDRNGNIVKHHVGFFADKKGDYENDIKKVLDK